LAQRSRKRGRREAPVAPPAETQAEAPRPSRGERTEAKNRATREALRPLAPGERPGAVTVGAIVAVVLAALVLIGYASGARVGGEGSLGGAILLAAILLLAAWGMWRARYWAVLGFEALLAFQLVIAALSLAVASNLWAALLCLAVIVLGGWLFWKLIRAMARIQMPERSAPR
jgi:cation transport ATPase